MNQINELQDLIRQLVNGIQQVLQSGEALSDEFQGMIAQTLSAAMQRLEQLMAGEQEVETAEAEEAQVAEEIGPPAPPAQPPTGGPVPSLEQAPFESSNINAFKYDPKSQQLYVKFQGKYPQQNGPVYKYEGVPKYIFEVFNRGAVGPKTSGSNAWHTWKRGVTPSHGAAMAALIKNGGFPYQRMR
jgi:hypothetical protein